MNIKIRSKNNIISYQDSCDHFENAVLRLLNLDFYQFKDWLNYSEEVEGPLLHKLKHGFTKLKPVLSLNEKKSGYGPNGEVGKLWYSLSDNYHIVKSLDSSIAWLAKEENNCLLKETNPPIYEESYFEGDSSKDGGYGEYSKQATWRLEKSEKQVQEIINITKLSNGNVLDIGSGYGYFRKSLQDRGFNHDGLEISKHARKICKNLYDFDSFSKTLDNYVQDFCNKYDLITMWDIIEHVPNPIFFLQDAAKCLKAGGFLVLKTPNIDCPEVDIFGSYYHSFKREHLVYFSKNSLVKLAQLAGFELIEIKSISHLLTGFIGEAASTDLSKNCQGTDLIAYFKKK